MKIKILIILFLMIIQPVFAENCENICSTSGINIIAKENFFKKIMGIGLATKKILETIIKRELGKEFNSKVDANIELFNTARLKNGEFKSLSVSSKNIRNGSIAMSEFYAETVCPFNQVVYKNNRIYYPNDILLKYKSTITNEDIEYIINSTEVQNNLKKLANDSANNFYIKTPKIYLKNNKVYFEIPIVTPLFNAKVKFNADITVQNNRIVLKSISKISNPAVADKLKFLFGDIENFDTKEYKIFITKAEISDNIIEAEGIFRIKKNYDGVK